MTNKSSAIVLTLRFSTVSPTERQLDSHHWAEWWQYRITVLHVESSSFVEGLLLLWDIFLWPDHQIRKNESWGALWRSPASYRALSVWLHMVATLVAWWHSQTHWHTVSPETPQRPAQYDEVYDQTPNIWTKIYSDFSSNVWSYTSWEAASRGKQIRLMNSSYFNNHNTLEAQLPILYCVLLV